jgi:hypothetical protein
MKSFYLPMKKKNVFDNQIYQNTSREDEMKQQERIL